jgi:hypothetical protein
MCRDSILRKNLHITLYACHHSCAAILSRRIVVQAGLHRGVEFGTMAQVVEHLPSKYPEFKP